MGGQGQKRKNRKTRLSKEKWENKAKRGNGKNMAKSRKIGKAGTNRKHRRKAEQNQGIRSNFIEFFKQINESRPYFDLVCLHISRMINSSKVEDFFQNRSFIQNTVKTLPLVDGLQSLTRIKRSIRNQQKIGILC